MEDNSWHFPPDLVALATETIWRINRTKDDLLNFFRGVGTPSEVLQPHVAALKEDREAFKKPIVSRELVRALNELKGNDGIAVRRRLLQRLYDFDAFSTLYDSDQHAAKGLVVSIRQFVDAEDAKRKAARNEHNRTVQHMRESQQKVDESRHYADRREDIKRRFYLLFGNDNPQRRGKALEQILNEFFSNEQIGVRESFTIVNEASGTIDEQIDGVIELDSHTYLLEMKWYDEPVGKDQIIQHMYRVFQRSQTRGIFVVHPGYTRPAINAVIESLGKAPFVLCTVEELVTLMESSVRAADWLRHKIKLVLEERRPLVPFERS